MHCRSFAVRTGLARAAARRRSFDRDHRRGRAAHPDRHRAASPARARCRPASARSCAPTSSAAACSAALELPPLVPAPTESHHRQLFRVARAPRRRAGRRLGRERGPTAASRCASACTTWSSRQPLGGIAYTLDQGPGARDRAPHRRLRLREADRRERRVLDAHRLRREARQPLRAADRRRRRRGRGDRARLVRADHLARLVARRQAPRLRVVREQEAGGLRPLAARRQAPGGGQLQGLELGAGLGARRQDASR